MIALPLTIVLNVMFILDAGYKLKYQNSEMTFPGKYLHHSLTVRWLNYLDLTILNGRRN